MYLKRTAHILSAAVVLSVFAVSCTVDPFVDISPNGTGVPLPEEKVFSESFSDSLVRHIRKETFYDAATVVKDGKVIFSYGDCNLPMNCASARKSIYSMLYGIASDRGIVDLDKSLAYYGVDDSCQPLTETEKTATIRQLLQARSGIYLKALGESDSMKERKPARGSYLPGEHFYYNNFDFNVLPIILERLTGKTVGELVYEWLALPSGMTHFKPEDVTYEYAGYTDFPQTRMYMSCEDLARAGMIMEQGGMWNGTRLISEEWTRLSVEPVSQAPQDKDLEGMVCEGYAYLWWVDMEAGTFWANGAYGQFMIVDRQRSLVVVLRNNSGLNPIGFVENMIKNEYQDDKSAKVIYESIVKELDRI